MKEFNNSDTKSRFIKVNDDQTNFLLYPIPQNWWSRLYEYKWASKFVEKDDVCLDAACGTFHHLKFYLAYLCKKVYACDLDKTVLNKEIMLGSIEASFGKNARDVSENIYDKIDFSDDNLTNLSYSDKKFDKIYCISVIEHLPEELIGQAFKEFTRVLKDDGLLVLTFDYPDIKFDILRNAIEEANLSFYNGVEYEIPSDVLESWNISGLKCFRALLKKKC